MFGIFLDGESKTGKTTVGQAIEQALSPYFKVYTAAAGSFYRRVTLLAIEKHGDYKPGATDWLDGSLRDALASDRAYDESRDWSDVHSKQVDELVSVAGQFDFMQAAGLDWWQKTADLAFQQGADVLVIDGRNPRKKLAPWREQHPGDMPIALDICVYCTPEIAGERYARAHTDGEPTRAQISEARDMIAQRRHLDLTRTATPYVEPEDQILFDPLSGDAAKTIRESFETSEDAPPRVIRYDTTNSPMSVTLRQAGALAQSAVSYLERT
jgi:cytidylate kinase